MKIPAKIKIGCVEIVIKKDSRVSSQLNERQVLGEWHPQLQEIWLFENGAIPHLSQPSTFWHESIEAINDIFNAELTHHQIYLLAVGIAQIIQSVEEEDNKP